jgi:hypothetical protein
MNDPLQITLADAVEFLELHHIAYALVGGLAVSLRGQPRVTADVDMVIAIDLDRALQIVDELNNSKFAPLFSGVADVIQRSFILPIRHRDTGVKVDLAIGLSGFEQQAIQRANIVEVGGCPTKVATAEDLVIMKVLAGRPQDEQDLAGLVVTQSSSFDWDYCIHVARELSEVLGQDLVKRVIALRVD